MKKLLVIIAMVFFVSCDKPDPKEQLANINGYWEISQVKFAKDSTRQFTISENIDYIQIENGKGFRKKVRPQIGGTYLITDDEEMITTSVENDELKLHYKTLFQEWTETVLTATPDELSLENERGIIYRYKRYTPILDNFADEKE